MLSPSVYSKAWGVFITPEAVEREARSRRVRRRGTRREMPLVNRITFMQHRFGYLRGRPLRERMKIVSTGSHEIPRITAIFCSQFF